jgi:hypothetical protein
LVAKNEKITWITCPDCGSKIGIVISVGNTETPRIVHGEKEEWPPQAAGGVLEAVGVDTSLLDIEENEATIQVTPKRFLGDQWGPINDKIREMGGTWIRDGRNSRWEIPKEQT